MHPSKITVRFWSILAFAGLLAFCISANGQTPAPANPPAANPATIAPPRGAVLLSDQPPKVDPATSPFESLRQKAEAGDADAQFNLGNCYSNGDGVEKNAVEAAKWYRKAADQGDTKAQRVLGGCYLDGDGVEKNAVEAAKWQRKAAEQGDAGGQFMLGLCYQEGWGVGKDLVEAAQWFLKSANQGEADAQLMLGSYYHNGTGVQQDDEEAAKWFRKAADQGNADAQYNLGASYYSGTGIERDIAEAVKWYRKAAEQGNAWAQDSLGLCYSRGDGVEKDDEEAAKWFLKSAQQGNADAQAHLGASYQKGVGVEKDAANAVRWYRKSANQGNAGAQFALGWCYAKGVGVQKDVAESAQWFLKAAEQGNNLAQGETAFCYIQGLGVIKNEVEGLAWMYVCSAGGNEGMAKVLSSEETHYSPSVISEARQRATDLQAQMATSKAPTNKDSAAALSPLSANNTPKASGSGAFISADGLLLTAAHVVQGATRIEIVTASGALTATVVKIDATNDVAILKCTGSGFTPLPIAPSKEVRAGTSVFTIGFPNIQVQGFDPKLTSGEISSQTGFQDDPRQWQISVPIQPGNSGGPLCDEQGNLIGIVEATLDPITMAKVAGEIPQNVNYAVKSSYILPLLDDVQNLPIPLGGSGSTKFEDVVANAQKSVVLILVY